MNIPDILAESDRVRELVRAEMTLTAAAYNLPCPDAPRTVPPRETPSPAFVQARAEMEARAGVRLVKFFSPTLGAR